MNRELVKAVLVLPGTALVYVPGAILWLSKEMAPAGPAEPRFWIGAVLGVVGFAAAVWTVRLFAGVGQGTPAPWAPPAKLVVHGPYRHVRNPMISSVLVMLAAESLLLGSWHIAGWTGRLLRRQRDLLRTGRGTRPGAALRRELPALQGERAALDTEMEAVGPRPSLMTGPGF